jgi:aldehyde dehydrogenase (NAD+)
MKIAREEIFGPVLTAIPYRDIDDAVSIANDSEYGLAGAVLSENPDAASRVAQRIRAGSIMINGAMSYGADCPFGGYKQSGIGRQNGVEGFEQYLETKAIATPQ